MRQVPRSPLSFKLQHVANVPEHPPPSTRLMSCAHIANRRLSRIIGARLSNLSDIIRSPTSGAALHPLNCSPPVASSSGNFLPPSPPAEQATARRSRQEHR